MSITAYSLNEGIDFFILVDHFLPGILEQVKIPYSIIIDHFANFINKTIAF
jgi:hypothetical protein